jgi:hypothetical protein
MNKIPPFWFVVVALAEGFKNLRETSTIIDPRDDKKFYGN